MWIITLFFGIWLMVSINSSPADTPLSSDDMDDFYHELKDMFQQYIKEFPSSVQQNQEAQQIGTSTPQIETTERFEFVTKLKRDSSAAEGHALKEKAQQSGLSPLYPCDRYDIDTHTCVNIRQIGTTLTLGVKIEDNESRNKYRIRWYRHFKRRQSLFDLREELEKGKSPWNINIGGNNNELRISPITETDFNYNFFIAVAESISTNNKKREKQKQKMTIKFHIYPIHIDMGVLYPGEELVIYARAFMELPVDSIVLEWSLSNADFTTRYDLPSNMKVNVDGSSVMVKELRTSIDRILTCSVFTNRNIFVARRNFLFRKIGQESGRNFDLRQSYKRRRKRSYDNEGFLENEDIRGNLKKYDRSNDDSEPDTENQYSNEDNRKFRKSSLYHPTRESQSLFYSRENDDAYGGGSGKRITDDDTKYYDGDSDKRITDDNTNYNGNLDGRITDNTKYFSSDTDRRISDDNNNHYDDDSNTRITNDNTKYYSDDSDRKIADDNNQENGFLKNKDSDLQIKLKHSSYRSRRAHSPHLNIKDHSSKKHPKDISVYNEKEFDSSYAEDKGKEDNSYSLEDDDESNKDIQLKGLIQKANSLVHSPKEKMNLNTNLESDGDRAPTFDDLESILISDCSRDSECSVHATCQKNDKGKHFCRCSPRYKGNGIFCWLM